MFYTAGREKRLILGVLGHLLNVLRIFRPWRRRHWSVESGLSGDLGRAADFDGTLERPPGSQGANRLGHLGTGGGVVSYGRAARIWLVAAGRRDCHGLPHFARRYFGRFTPDMACPF